MANDSSSLEEYVRFEVSEQGLLAIATFRDPPPAIERTFTLKELKTLVMEQKYSYGVIDDHELASILDRWLGVMTDLVIARGAPPGQPIDESLEFCFERNPVPMPQLLADDRVDYRELGILQNARSGQTLVRKIPGQLGAPGLDVFGNEVPSDEPKQKILPMGPGTQISDDGLFLISEIDGQIVYSSDHRVSVVPVYHVEEDVDFSTGNIDFFGSVVVHGSVREGFTITASGNIEVFGIVERATLKADGDIIIRGGVQGSAKTEIFAKGSIRVLYLQNSVVHAGNDLVVADSVMHSVLRAQTLRVTGKRGLLVGGLARIDQYVFVRILGSHLGTATRIEFSSNAKEDEQYYILCSQIASFEGTLVKMAEALTKLLELEKRVGILSSEQKTIMDRLHVTETSVREQLGQTQIEQEALETMIGAKKPQMVEIKNMVYPGVLIMREHFEWHCDDFITGCKLVCNVDGWHRALER